MAQLLLVNPRRKRRTAKKTSSRARRRSTRSMVANPRRRRTRKTSAVTAAPRRRRRRASFSANISKRVSRARRRTHSGKSFLTAKGFMNETLIPSAVGAGGALGLDLLMGYLPLPAAVQTGALRPVTRLALAAALGLIATKVAGRKVGEQVAAGAVTVVVYDTFKSYAKKMMPNLPLSGYGNLELINTGVPVGVGEYVTYNDPNAIVQPIGMGEYVGY